LTFTASKTDNGQDCLRCEINDRTWPSVLTLEPVNAQYWLVTRTQARSPVKTALKAESKLGIDGKVRAIGVVMEPYMPDEIFWFELEG